MRLVPLISQLREKEGEPSREDAPFRQKETTVADRSVEIRKASKSARTDRISTRARKRFLEVVGDFVLFRKTSE